MSFARVFIRKLTNSQRALVDAARMRARAASISSCSAGSLRTKPVGWSLCRSSGACSLVRMQRPSHFWSKLPIRFLCGFAVGPLIALGLGSTHRADAVVGSNTPRAGEFCFAKRVQAAFDATKQEFAMASECVSRIRDSIQQHLDNSNASMVDAITHGMVSAEVSSSSTALTAAAANAMTESEDHPPPYHMFHTHTHAHVEEHPLPAYNSVLEVTEFRHGSAAYDISQSLAPSVEPHHLASWDAIHAPSPSLPDSEQAGYEDEIERCHNMIEYLSNQVMDGDRALEDEKRKAEQREVIIRRLTTEVMQLREQMRVSPPPPTSAQLTQKLSEPAATNASSSLFAAIGFVLGSLARGW